MNNENETLNTQQPDPTAAGPEPENTTPVEENTAAPQEPAAPAEEGAGAAQRLEQMDAAEAATQPPEQGGPVEQPAEPFPQQQQTPPPAYAQPAPAPYAYQEPREESATDGAKKPKSAKNLVIVGGIIAAIVVLLIVAFALGLGGGKSSGEAPLSIPSRAKDPEGYLNAVVHNTTLELKGDSVLNLARFQGKPVAHDFSLDIDLGSMAYYYMAPSSIGVNGSIKLDQAKQRMLMDLGVTSSFISFSGNQFYMTPDVIAFSIPALISKYDYVTINTDTFVEDYEDSMFYSPYSGLDLDSDFSLRSEIEALFNPAQVENPLAEKFDNNVNERVEKFQASATFRDEGTVTETINGKSIEVSKMSYTYLADDVEWLYEDLLDELESFLQEQQTAYMTSSMSYSSDVDEIMAVLDSIEFVSDLVVRYTINDKDQVVRIEIEKLNFTVKNSEYYLDDEFQMDFVIELQGEDNIGDKVRATIDLYSYEEDESVAMEFRYDKRDSGDMVARRYTLDIIDSDNDAVTLTADFEWRPKEDGKNMRLTFEAGDENEAVGVRLTGNMQNAKDEFSITGGSMVLYDEDDDTLYELGFEYKQYEISSSDVELDLDKADTILFSELRERDFSFF